MWKKLQNGTDIRGVASEGIPGEEINFTPEIANRIASAFVMWLSKREGKAPQQLRIGVGRDSRISGEAIAEGILKGILSTGAAAFNCHMASTPAMFMGIIYGEFAFDGSIMITASHLPFNRNGMKFFCSTGGLEHDDITEILNMAAGMEIREADTNMAVSTDLISAYSHDLAEKIRAGTGEPDNPFPLKGLHILVDAGNGAGGFFVSQVLAALGADTTGSQFLNPDGSFPNHIPNPENKEAMASITKAVIENRADLGIIFDTDVDRMSAVLSDGSSVNRDGIIAIMSAILAPDYPGATIVTDSVTSDRLQEFIEGRLGLKQYRYKRGYKNVINECIRLNENGIISPLAIETSGHGALKENFYLDDGAYMAVKLIIAAAKCRKEGKTLDSLLEGFSSAYEEAEFRIRISGDDFGDYGREVCASFMDRAMAKGYDVVPDNKEGVRISFHSDEISGWLLLRMSLHDPLLPLNMEGCREGDCRKMKELTRELLKDFDRLDLSILSL